MVGLRLEQSQNKREKNLVKYGGPRVFVARNQLDREERALQRGYGTVPNIPTGIDALLRQGPEDR